MALTNEEKVRIAQALRLHLDGQGTVKKVSNDIKGQYNLSISTSYLSNISNGIFSVKTNTKKGYTEYSDEYFIAIARYLGLYAEQVQTAWRTVKLDSYYEMWDWCDGARKRSKVLCITGETSMSKTTAVKAYQLKHKDTTTLFRCRASFTKLSFVKNLCNAVGVRSRGRTDEDIESISQALARRKHLLIIDEAEHLKDAMWELLKDLYDLTEESLAIVVVIHKNGLREYARKANRGYRCSQQIFRRFVADYREVPPLGVRDLNDIIHQLGLDKASWVNTDALRWMVDQGKARNYSTMKRYVEDAFDLHKREGKVVGMADMQAMFGEEKDFYLKY